MRVGIYAGASHPAVTALLQGFALCGATAHARNSAYHRGEIENFDLVVVYGLRAGCRVRDAYQAAGVAVVVFDWGYLARVNEPSQTSTGHFQFGLGGLNRPPAFACPTDRFDSLGLTIAEQGGDPDGYVLLCGQVPGDAAHGLDAQQIESWAREAAAHWPNVRYRPHPRGGIDIAGLESDRSPLAKALAGARRVVTINSNVGHDALLAGVPVLADGPAAYAELAGDVLPTVEARREYFARLAYGQWTVAEMASGACPRFLLDHLVPGVGPAIEGQRPDDAEPGVQESAGSEDPRPITPATPAAAVQAPAAAKQARRGRGKGKAHAADR